MDIGLILSIAVGVVLGGLILIYRDKIVDKGKEAAELTAEGAKVTAKATGRGISAIRGWLISIAVVAGIVILFVVSRVEGSFEHWKANQALWGEIRAACKEKGGSPERQRQYFYCDSPRSLEEADRWIWQYDRYGCQMIYYAGGAPIREYSLYACGHVADFGLNEWQEVIKEGERKARNQQP